jgi:putative two-component system response regulator
MIPPKKKKPLKKQVHPSVLKVRHAYEKLQKANDEVKEAYMAIVLKLAIIAEYRDSDTGGHIMRISDYGCEVAKALGLSAKEIEVFRFASPMHDIGKIATPDSILKKEGGLTPEEFEVMKGHTVIGARMFDGSASPILKAAADICRAHHEKWDGSGYPYGLKGDAIPLFARILAVVDVFDALTSKRCYKEAWSYEDALKHLKKGAGKHFDPHIINTFLKIQPQIRHIYESSQTIQSFLTDYEILALKRESEKE